MEQTHCLTKHRHTAFFVLCLSLVFLLTSCETLSSRLTRNQKALHSLPLEHQNFIRQGKIKVGFTPIEVYLAWGTPHHKSVTESTRGSLETWLYTQTHTETYYRQQRVYDTYAKRWEIVDKPYQVHSKYVVKEAVFQDARVDSFTLYPSAAKLYR